VSRIDDISLSMTFELYFDLTWSESRMLINESATEWEVDDSVMGSTNFIKSLWLPDIQILNLKQFQKRQIVTDVAGLIIFKNKKVLYTISTEAIISCPMKFSAYPLDHQVKNLILDTLWFHDFSDDFFDQNPQNSFLICVRSPNPHTPQSVDSAVCLYVFEKSETIIYYDFLNQINWRL
jgi:hypothetical protein